MKCSASCRPRICSTPTCAGESPDVRAHVRPAPTVPDTADALDVVDIIKESAVHIALVHDEYGHFEGIVTNADILEAIVGVFSYRRRSDRARRRAARRRLVADRGHMPADEMADRLGITIRRSALITRRRDSCSTSSAICRKLARPSMPGLALRGDRPRRPAHRQDPGPADRRRPAPGSGLARRDRWQHTTSRALHVCFRADGDDAEHATARDIEQGAGKTQAATTARNADGTIPGRMRFARSGLLHQQRFMWSNSPPIRSRPMRRSSTVRPTATSAPTERSTRTAHPPATRRCTRSSSTRRMASIRCPTWRFRPMANPGKRNVEHRELPRRWRARASSPTVARSFEEINLMSIMPNGTSSAISSKASVDFFRIAPPSSYAKGLPQARHCSIGAGDITPEIRGKHFYRTSRITLRQRRHDRCWPKSRRRAAHSKEQETLWARSGRQGSPQ